MAKISKKAWSYIIPAGIVTLGLLVAFNMFSGKEGYDKYRKTCIEKCMKLMPNVGAYENCLRECGN